MRFGPDIVLVTLLTAVDSNGHLHTNGLNINLGNL